MERTKYRVRFFIDDTYEVIDEEGESRYQGSLTNCEAWIRLTEDGRM